MKKGKAGPPKGWRATSEDALTALAQEADRRGVSYGMLVANTDVWERDEIVRKYCAKKYKKRKEG